MSIFTFSTHGRWNVQHAATIARGGQKVFVELDLAGTKVYCYLHVDKFNDVEIHSQLADGDPLFQPQWIFIIQKAMLSQNWQVVDKYPWEV